MFDTHAAGWTVVKNTSRSIETCIYTDDLTASFLFVPGHEITRRIIRDNLSSIGVFPITSVVGVQKSINSAIAVTEIRTAGLSNLSDEQSRELLEIGTNGKEIDVKILSNIFNDTKDIILNYSPDPKRGYLYKEIFDTKKIIVEQSPPQVTDFVSILKSGSGSMIGAYIGFRVAGEFPLLLLVTVPFGMLICASAMGMAQAVEGGLKERLHKLIRKRTVMAQAFAG